MCSVSVPVIIPRLTQYAVWHAKTPILGSGDAQGVVVWPGRLRDTNSRSAQAQMDPLEFEMRCLTDILKGRNLFNGKAVREFFRYSGPLSEVRELWPTDGGAVPR